MTSIPTCNELSLTMTQQAFPSILLSVAIVCFFAVALHRREARPPDAQASVVRRKPADKGEKWTARSVQKPERGTTERPPAPIVGRRESATRDSAGGPMAEARKVVSAANRSEPGIRRATRPSTGRARLEPPTRPPTVQATRPALTIARSGETIADVARRVYGGNAGADVLLRANRDVVSDTEATIPAGTVLRTPAPPVR